LESDVKVFGCEKSEKGENPKKIAAVSKNTAIRATIPAILNKCWYNGQVGEWWYLKKELPAHYFSFKHS